MYHYSNTLILLYDKELKEEIGTESREMNVGDNDLGGKKLHRPGVEPGSRAWEARMITATLPGLPRRRVNLNQMSSALFSPLDCVGFRSFPVGTKRSADSLVTSKTISHPPVLNSN